MVLTAGDTVIVLPVWPLDHKTISGLTQPEATKFILVPEHIVVFDGAIVGVAGIAFTVTERGVLSPLAHITAPLPLQVAV